MSSRNKLPDIVLIVPCYNEGHRLDTARFISFAEQDPSLNYFFVNDGSTDHTAKRIDQIVEAIPGRARRIDLTHNQGKAMAVWAGLTAATDEGRYQLVGYWDADLATPLEVLPGLRDCISSQPNRICAIGTRVRMLGYRIHRTRPRHYLGRCFATLASMVLDLPIYDTQCGAKLFKNNEVLVRSLEDKFMSKWIFDVELIGRIKHHANITTHEQADELLGEYPLPYWRDVAGSKIKSGHFAIATLDLFRVWKQQSKLNRRISGQ